MLEPSFLAHLKQHVSVKFPQVQLLVLFGSRATGNGRESSDWDIAVLAPETSSWELLWMQKDLADLLQISFNQVDLVNLGRCSPLMAYGVAFRGKCLYESEEGLFRRFQVNAWKRYVDTEKLRKLESTYIERTLEKLCHDCL
jgi:predicted nucleotidyltransferase